MAKTREKVLDVDFSVPVSNLISKFVQVLELGYPGDGYEYSLLMQGSESNSPLIFFFFKKTE